MTMTKLENLVEAVVVAQGIKAQVDKIKFMPLASVENFSNQQVGTIQVPKYTYIGNAEVIGEGEDIDLTQLNQTSENLTIQKVGKGVNITDEAVKGGIGNPVAEAETQLAASITQKMEADLAEALKGATLSEEVVDFSFAEVIKGQSKFAENADQPTVLVVNPAAMSTVQVDKAYMDGKLGNLEVIYSNKVEANTGYLVQPGALGFYLAENIEVESARNIINKTTTLTADAFYAVHLKDASKAVKLTVA